MLHLSTIAVIDGDCRSSVPWRRQMSPSPTWVGDREGFQKRARLADNHNNIKKVHWRIDVLQAPARYMTTTFTREKGTRKIGNNLKQ